MRPAKIHIHEELGNLHPRLWGIKKGKTVHTQGERGHSRGRNPEISMALQSLKMYKYQGTPRASCAGQFAKVAGYQAGAVLESGLTDFLRYECYIHTERYS